MAVFKCKMCGGTIDVRKGQNVVTCEYCGTTQTVHSFDNEKKNTFFKRAEALRFKCEFDKASGIYETIVSEFPNEAEAYWGLILCKYGIEYVDDPKTGEKIPTCHRTQFSSIYDDTDYKNVLKNADVISKDVYEKEAKSISKLQKSILEISSKEDPFDIFICYKETDKNGDRTLDSVLAQEIYRELIDEGYRVFFSRITLEDKLGSQYEPYIFAALHSSKIMIHVTTSDENSESIWVRNEWSRYLSLIQEGQKKTLIPCYKGITAYDLPDEMQNLQGQDMSKLGAMQDLVRGVNKLIKKNQRANNSVLPSATLSAEQDAFESQMRKGYVYLSKSMWDDAEETFKSATKLVEKCGRAYIGLLLASSGVSSLSDYLEEYGTDDSEFEKTLDLAKTFADEKCLEELKKGFYDYYCEAINQLFQKNQFQEAFDLAYKCDLDYKTDSFIKFYKANLFTNVERFTEEDLTIFDVDELQKVADIIEDFGNDATKKYASVCKNLILKIREDYKEYCIDNLRINCPPKPTLINLEKAISKLKENINIYNHFKFFDDETADIYKTIQRDGYEYVGEKTLELAATASTLTECYRIEKIADSLENRVIAEKILSLISKQRSSIAEVNKQVARRKRIKGLKISGIVCAGLAVAVAVAFGIKAFIDSNNKKATYSNAAVAMESGNYDDAIAYYESLGDYEEAKKKIEVCKGLKQLEASIESKSEADTIAGIKTIVSAGEKVSVSYNTENSSSIKKLNANSGDRTEVIENVDFSLYKPSWDGYKFLNWNSKSISYKDNLASLSLISNWQLVYYSITYDVDGGTNNVDNPSDYSIESKDISLKPASKYGYHFLRWTDINDKEVTKIIHGSTGNIRLKAKFEINTYNVVFKNYNGTVLYETTCTHGSSVQFVGDTPTKPADAQYTYTFSGWYNPIYSLDNIITDTIFTAQFSETTNKYTVTFRDSDGTLLGAKTVDYGTSATITPPSSKQDDNYSYYFDHWNPDVSNVTHNIETYAVYRQVQRLNISFKDGDGSIIHTAKIDKNTAVGSYNGPAPTKTTTAQYTYSWTGGWDKSLSSILTSDTIFTATFNSNLRSYTVSYIDGDGTIYSTKIVNYGDYAGLPSTSPTKSADDVYIYNWTGWDVNPSTAVVTGDVSFTAQFTASEHNCTFVEQSGSITLTKYDGTAANVIIPKKVNNKYVTKIGEKAFYQNAKLEYVFIPQFVQFIDNDAFYKCSKLSNVEFEHNSQLTTIDGGAFYYCGLVTKGEWKYHIIIPKNVTTIGAYALSVYLDIGSFYGTTFVPPLRLFFESTTLPSNLSSNYRDSSYYIYNLQSCYANACLYSEASKQPSGTGTSRIYYWHYVDDVPTIWE